MTSRLIAILLICLRKMNDYSFIKEITYRFKAVKNFLAIVNILRFGLIHFYRQYFVTCGKAEKLLAAI